MFILLHGGLETIILFVFGEELYNKYKINNNKNNIGMSRKKDKVKGIVFGKKTGKLYYSPTDAEGHVVCFAGSGLGKTSSILYLHYNTGTERVMSLIFQEIYARM